MEKAAIDKHMAAEVVPIVVEYNEQCGFRGLAACALTSGMLVTEYTGKIMKFKVLQLAKFCRKPQ